MRILACERIHFEVVSSWALEARAWSSFSKFSCVKRGAEASILGTGGADVEAWEEGFLGLVRAMARGVEVEDGETMCSQPQY